MTEGAAYGLNFHHFGLAVRDYDKGAKFLRGLGYTIGARIFDPLQKVDVTICSAPDQPTIELVAAASDDSPIANVLKRQETSVSPSSHYSAAPDAAIAPTPAPAILDNRLASSLHRLSVGNGKLITLACPPTTFTIYALYITQRPSLRHSRRLVTCSAPYLSPNMH